MGGSGHLQLLQPCQGPDGSRELPQLVVVQISARQADRASQAAAGRSGPEGRKRGRSSAAQVAFQYWTQLFTPGRAFWGVSDIPRPPTPSRPDKWSCSERSLLGHGHRGWLRKYLKLWGIPGVGEGRGEKGASLTPCHQRSGFWKLPQATT